MKRPCNASMNRRTFLATSAAGFTLAATHAEATAKFRVGLIGCGETGRTLFTAAANMPIHISAVADTDVRCFDGIPAHVRRTTDWKSLVNDAQLDGLIIASPDYLHMPMARAALHAGKHVYLVPPLAHSSNEVDTLVHTADRATGQLYIAKDLRATAHWVQYRNALVADQIGRPQWIQADIPTAAHRATGHWSHDCAKGYGDAATALYGSLYALMDTFELDAPRTCSLLGGVFANDGRQTPDALTFSAEFEGGMRVTLTARSAGRANRPTTLRTLDKTFELSPYPGDSEFDLANWATQLHKGCNAVDCRLPIARNTQVALDEALDRNANIRESRVASERLA